MTTFEYYFTISKLLGGVALFIYGMNVMSSELQKSAAHRMRTLLYKLTTRPVSGFGVGSLLGFLIHSGPVVLMAVGFTNAGLMTLEQSIGVTVGANVGTTLSMQLVSFHITHISYLLIFLGLAIHLAFRKKTPKHVGLVVFGFGLLFLGLEFMSQSVKPLQSLGYFETLIRYTNASTTMGLLTGFLLSAVFTGVIQSSGATIAMLFALSSAGVLTDFAQVFPWVLGAHVGTCATPLIGAIGGEVTAKRTALAHLLFNVIGSVVAMVMYRFYAWGIPAIGGDLTRQVANAHTLVQLVNALMFLPLTRSYCRLLVRLTRVPGGDPEKSYLDDTLLATPEKAIVAAFMELRRMSVIARHMFQEAMRGFLDLDPQRFVRVRKYEDVLDSLKDAIQSYLVCLAERDLSRRQSIIIQYLTTATNDLERIGDHVENIAKVTDEKLERKIWFEDAAVQDLIDLYKKTDKILALLVKSFEPSFYESPSKLAAEILEKRNEYVQLSFKVKEKHNNQLLEKKEDPLVGMYFFRLIVCFDKLVKHSKTIALVEKERFFFIKKHKMEKTASVREKTVEFPEVAPLEYDRKLFEE